MDTSLSRGDLFANVIHRLNALAPERQASYQHTGGGIFCIEVRTTDGFAWFGTENDAWGADMYRGDEYEESIDTGVPIETSDADTVARAILAAVADREKKSPQ